MAITRTKKEEVVTELSQELGRAKMTVMASFTGLTVKEAEELRRTLRAENVRYVVAKNSLFKLALKDAKIEAEIPEAMFGGPIGYTFGYEDEVAPAQLLDRFRKQHPKLSFVGAVTAEGAVLSAEEVQRLASLPSKEQLTAQLVGTIAAPMSGFMNVLGGNLRGLVQVLKATAEAKS